LRLWCSGDELKARASIGVSDVEAGRTSPEQVLDHMNRVLFTENGFCIEWGDRGEEHLNGSLAAALDTRSAPPLLLAIVYQAVAARLGVELAFCNFPGHVLLRAEGARTASITDGVDGEPQWFVDPAARGRRLLPAQVCDALRRLGMAEEDNAAWTTAVDPVLVWARILRAVETNAKRGGDKQRAWFFRSLGGGLHPPGIKTPEARLDLMGQRLAHIWPVDHYTQQQEREHTGL